MKGVSTNNILAFSILFLITLTQTSCTFNFNPSDELNRIEKIINNGEADSVSGHDDEDRNYKYWIKDGKIIKLYTNAGNYECVFYEEYYFKEDGNVFANKTVEICPPNATDYKALITFNGTSIVTEEYWLSDSIVSKSDIQKTLNQSWNSIEENILKDHKTKKIKGILNLKDFAERFKFEIPEKGDTKNKISDTHADNASKQNQEEKTLFFEQQWGPYENQKTSYQFTFKGIKIEILYKYSDYTSPIVKAELKNGKIITEYGYSDKYVMNLNSLCVPNPETDESDCYAFIRSKSTDDIEAVLNPGRKDNPENQSMDNSNSNPTKQFNDIQLTLTDATYKKAKIYLGEPDKYENGFGHFTKGFAIYYNIVSNQNGNPKHLVLFLRMNGNQWGNNAEIEEIYSIEDNQKACFGIHCLQVANGKIKTNAANLDY